MTIAILPIQKLTITQVIVSYAKFVQPVTYQLSSQSSFRKPRILKLKITPQQIIIR